MECAEEKVKAAPAPEKVGGARRFAWHITELPLKSGRGPRAKLLHNIRGYADVGTCTAILGPSGAGKSSLLDCMALRNRNFRGTLLVDGKPFTGPFGCMAAYVYQSDLCFAALTVREHLVFQALSRLGGSMTAAECHKRVDEVMRAVHLELVANSVIGGNINGIKLEGISGGERKRLNIASELLSDPAILFLDEPTSGLDSNVSEVVCLNLRRLAKEAGRIVIAAIHAPSSNVFACFTHVTVLSWNGELTYMGASKEMLPSLEMLGFQCPTYCNPADFILKLSSRRVADDGCEDVDGYRKSGASDGDYQRLVTAYSARPSIADLTTEPEDLPSGSDPSSYPTSLRKTALPASMGELVWINLQRCWIQQTRDQRGICMFRIVQDVFTAGIIGVAHRGLVGHGATYRSLIHINMASLGFNCMKAVTNGVIYMPDEVQILMREYYTFSNAAVPYYLAASVMALIFSALQLCSLAVVYVLSGHVIPQHGLGIEVATHFLNHCAGYWMSFCVTAVTGCGVQAAGLACVLVGALNMYAGVGLEVSRLNAATKWISDISFHRHGIAVLGLSHVSTLNTDWERGLFLGLLEVTPGEMGGYQRRQVLATMGLWALGLVALMIRVRVAKPV